MADQRGPQAGSTGCQAGALAGRQNSVSQDPGRGREKNNEEKEKTGKARTYLPHIKVIESPCPRLSGRGRAREMKAGSAKSKTVEQEPQSPRESSHPQFEETYWEDEKRLWLPG